MTKVIGLIDGDILSKKSIKKKKRYSIFPNYALMKISSYYKSLGYKVEWYSKLFHKKYYKIFGSQVFTFSDKSYITKDMIIGGTGIDINKNLPSKIEKCKPDYSVYPDFKQAMGMLTRGCIRKCKFCFVPQKEGNLKPYMDIEDIITDERKEIVLMDNNILASDYGIKQIEKIGKIDIKIDFNQGIDCRLIDNSIAKLLSKIKWSRALTMAYDQPGQEKYLKKAVDILRRNNVHPTQYNIYICFGELNDEIVERTMLLKSLDCRPYVQPERKPDGNFSSKLIVSDGTLKPEVKSFIKWVNQRRVFFATTWEDFNEKDYSKKYSKNKQQGIFL